VVLTHLQKTQTTGTEIQADVLVTWSTLYSGIGQQLLLCKTILKPIWTYGIPLRKTANNSNIEILQRLQNKVLRVLVNAPLYVSNRLAHSDLNVPHSA
jgi:hypothetical protein